MGACNNLMREISVEDPQQFCIFVRMSADNLEEILRRVGSLVSKKYTTMPEAISVAFSPSAWLVSGNYFR